MSATKWYASPLTGTAGVLLGLSLLAIPLRKLTSEEPVAAVQTATPAATTAHEIPAVLRMRLLAPARQVTVKTSDGSFLLDIKNPAAGESEHDAVIPFEGNMTDLTLDADLVDAAGESAVFLTIMPDGFEDQTRYAIGSGSIHESLHYEWPVH